MAHRVRVTTSPDNRFDGDQLNMTCMIDHLTTEELAALAPHKSTFSLDEPYKVSRNLSMPKTVVGTISNWIHMKDEDPNRLEKEQRMLQIPDARM